MDAPSAPQITVDTTDVLKEEECAEDFGPDDHLNNLKALTEKLKLETRRPSYLEWKARVDAKSFRELRIATGQLQAENGGDLDSAKEDGNGNECQLPSGVLQGLGSIDEALSLLRRELMDMRIQDQQLASQLMKLRSGIHQLKIEQTCHLHRRMLNDATFSLEERDELSDLLCESPVTLGHGLSAPLRLIGVTKMNINSRRFSLC